MEGELKNIEFYICVRVCKKIESGTIISEENGTKKIFPDGQNPICIDIDKLKSISREESLFLSKSPCEERLKMFKDKLFDKINNMKIGDHCILRSKPYGPLYTLTSKRPTKEGVKYSLVTKDKKIACVERSEIRLGGILENTDQKIEGINEMHGQQLQFVADKFVDVTNTLSIEEDETGITCGMKVGDNVATFIKRGMNGERIYHGELKWIGRINDVECVGIDLEDEFQLGMDGDINGKQLFECPQLHGVVTTIDNVDRKDTAGPSFNVDGTINANKYLKYEERWNEESMKERKVWKNGPVFVIIDNDDKGRWKRKGTLRWCGSMNGESVAVVELNEDYEHATDGLFWRHQLIKCGKKRAVAVKWQNVHEFIIYESKPVPFDDKCVDINSMINYIVTKDRRVQYFPGIVKWSGTREEDVYLYGLELEKVYRNGTDGEFDGQRLFQCRPGCGVLAPLRTVALDARFLETYSISEEVPESPISEEPQYTIPMKRWRGHNYGIQGGHGYHSFITSIFTLFSKSSVLDYMISPIVNKTEGDEVTKKFRQILAYEVVYPLREFGFVSSHHIDDLRESIQGYGRQFVDLRNNEIDVENVAKLLTKLCPLREQLLSIRTFNDQTRSGMFLQLFVTLDDRVTDISSQQMLDMSMIQSEIMFDTPPTCLIMQANRGSKGVNYFENIVPSSTISVSNICFPCFKCCGKCSKEASYQCKRCIEGTLQIKAGLWCDDHKCAHSGVLKFPLSDSTCRSNIEMHLNAIICTQNDNFVAYVKENEFHNEWITFDSISASDTHNRHSIPKVAYKRNISKFLDLSVAEMNEELKQDVSVDIERIVKDSYLFVYNNSALTCY